MKQINKLIILATIKKIGKEIQTSCTQNCVIVCVGGGGGGGG